jgi:hypothetical protein
MDSDERLLHLVEEAAQQRRTAVRLLWVLCALAAMCTLSAIALVTILLL